jgi:long-chain acyl-CoA synthetase
LRWAFKSNSRWLDVAVCTESGHCYSYKDIRDKGEAQTASLTERDLLAIECNNSLESLVAYVGAIQRRTPVLLVDRTLDDSKKSELYRHYQVSSIFRDGTIARLAISGPEMHSDLALLLSTSGSTGSPKLVRLSLSNIEGNARQISKYLGLTSSNRAITTLPQQYSFGLSIINSHFYVGGSIALTNRSIAERGFWDFFDLSSPDSLSGVPATFEMLKRMRFDRMNLKSLRTMTQAGGRLGEETVKFFSQLGKQKGFDFWVMYGQTEATARMAYLPTSETMLRSDSIGIAIPEGRFELVDSQGETVNKSSQVGELVFYGPNVMMGYATEVSDLAKGDVQNGKLATGDLAEFDSDGFFYIRGRIKRFIKLFGNRINLDDVEKELQRGYPGLHVAGKDDLLLLAGSNQNDLEDGAGEFSRRYHFHPSVVKTFILDPIPRNESGKVQYAEILKSYESRIHDSL